MSTLKLIWSRAASWGSKNAPTILTVVGIGGMISSTVLACQATPKYLTVREEAEGAKEHAKGFLECYGPSIAMGVGGVFCIINANRINLKRNALLLAAYQLAESSYKELSDKIPEVVGDKKAAVIKEEIAKDHLKKNPITEGVVIEETRKGEFLCYDWVSSRYFKTCSETIRKVQNDINYLLDSNDEATINDMYQSFGLSYTGNGESFGWRRTDSTGTRLPIVEISVIHVENPDTGIQCMALQFSRKPELLI